MGTARLNVWVTRENDPARIKEEQSFVHVLHLDGTVLEWCGTRYTDLPTKCGHLEVEVPPGCYAVCASADTNGSDEDSLLGNHLTHIDLVSVGCGETACARLFTPTISFCFTWFRSAVEQAVQGERLQRARPALEALDQLAQVLPYDPMTERLQELTRSRPWLS